MLYITHCQLAFQRPWDYLTSVSSWLVLTECELVWRWTGLAAAGWKVLRSANSRNMLNLMQLSPGAHAADLIVCGGVFSCALMSELWWRAGGRGSGGGQQASWSKGHARLDKDQRNEEEGGVSESKASGSRLLAPEQRGRPGSHISQTACCTHRKMI